MKDMSLYVPWDNSTEEMQKELSTIASIKKKNLQKFKDLRDEIMKLPTLDVSTSPIKEGECERIKQTYIEAEEVIAKSFEGHNEELNLLLEREASLQRDIVEMEKMMKDAALKEEEVKKRLKSDKKKYQAHEEAFNMAKKLYEKSFGVSMTVEEEGDGGCFKATVEFKTKCKAEFSFGERGNEITDFEASFVPPEQLQELKSDFRRTNNALALMLTLNTLAMQTN